MQYGKTKIRNNPDYTLIRIEESEMPIAGMFDRKKAMVDDSNAIPPHWGCYVTVKDSAAAVGKVEGLGGPGHRSARGDPEGGAFQRDPGPAGCRDRFTSPR